MSAKPGKDVWEKLGIREGMSVVVLGAPADYATVLGGLPDRVTVLGGLDHPAPFIHFFAEDRRALERGFPLLKRMLRPDGALWISWPKRLSGMKTDLTDSVVREIGLSSGLVDVKVCSVSETWSGLKFVYRLRDRA